MCLQDQIACILKCKGLLMQTFLELSFMLSYMFSVSSKLCVFVRSIYRYCTPTSLVVINDFILKHYVVFLRFLIIQRNISEYV